MEKKRESSNKNNKRLPQSEKDDGQLTPKQSLIFILIFAAIVVIWMQITYIKVWKNGTELHPARITDIYSHRKGLVKRWDVVYQYTICYHTYSGREYFNYKSDFGNRQVGDTIYVEVSKDRPRSSRWTPKESKTIRIL